MSPELIAAIAAIVVALLGGPVMWMLSRIDRNNTRQHADAAAERLAVAEVVKAELAAAASEQNAKFDTIDQKLDTTNGSVATLSTLVSTHLAYHAHHPSKEVA